MAEVRFYDSILSEDFESVFIKEQTLEEVINNYSPLNKNSRMIECYDSETGETYFCDIYDENDDENKDVLILVNDKSVGLDYEPLANEIVNVIILPQSSSADANYFWNGLVASIGLSLVGFGAGAIYGSMAGGIGAVPGAIAGAIVGGIAGWFVGYEATKNYYESNRKTNGQIENKALPIVQGSSNELLKNEAYPYIFGKTLVYPRIAGNPYTTFSGDHGKDAYLNIMFCVGYGPLKLTNFKLDEFFLAYNQNYNNVSHNTILDGEIRGTSANEDDTGAILDRWKNNDVTVEIIQNRDSWNSSVYPHKTIQKEVNSKVMCIYDDALKNVAEKTYQNKVYPNNFRTNTVIISEPYPKKVTVNIEFPNGCYRTKTYTKDSGSRSASDVVNESIDVAFVVQWRPCIEGDDPSQSSLSDYDDWNNFTCVTTQSLVPVFRSVTCDDSFIESNVAQLVGNSITKESVTRNNVKNYKITSTVFANTLFNNEHSALPLGKLDVSANGTSKINFSISAGSVTAVLNNWAPISGTAVNKAALVVQSNQSGTTDISGCCAIIGNVFYYSTGTNNRVTAVIFSDTTDIDVDSYTEDDIEYLIKYVVSNNKQYTWDYSDAPFSMSYTEGAVKVYGVDKNGKVYNASYTASSINTFTVNNVAYVMSNRKRVKRVKTTWEAYNYIPYENVKGEQVFTLENTLNHNSVNSTDITGNHYPLGDFRGTFTATLTTEQQKALLDNNCPSHCIEVRVVRITPNAFNQTGSDTGNWNYSENMQWVSMVTECYDNEKLKKDGVSQYLKAIPDEDVKKFCFVGLRCKADNAGYIANSLEKFCCEAESFSPIYDDTTKAWLPSDIHRVTKYYNSNNVEITKQQYEDNMINGDKTAKQVQEGSNYQETMYSLLMTDLSKIPYQSIAGNIRYGYVLLNEFGKYNEANMVSSFILSAIGPQNGLYALGYENIDLFRAADVYKACQAVTEGSKFDSKTCINGYIYDVGDSVTIKYEANGLVNSKAIIANLLSEIAACGRSLWTYDEFGRILIVMDKEVKYPVGVLNDTNMQSQSITFVYPKIPAGVQVTFNNRNDGYEQNQLYVMLGNQTVGSYKGDITPLVLKYVTDNLQAYSLGRWQLLSTKLNREQLSVKVGPEFDTVEIGDVLVYQSSQLLIGEGSGRIQEVIEDDDYIYGFVIDGTYENSGELVGGKSKLGVSVLQPKAYRKSRVITLRLAPAGESVTPVLDEDPVVYSSDGLVFFTDVNYRHIYTIPEGFEAVAVSGQQNIYTVSKVYTANEGFTNVVLLDERISKSVPNDAGDSYEVRYFLETNCLCWFGEWEQDRALYRVIKIKPEQDKKFTLTLINYDEKVYTEETIIPEFKPVVNNIRPTQDAESGSTIPATVIDHSNDKRDATLTAQNAVNSGANVTAPSTPSITTCVAHKDGIELVCTNVSDGTLSGTVSAYQFRISRDGGITWDSTVYSSKGVNYIYQFNRSSSIDGYPEASDLADYRFCVRALNAYDLTSEWSSAASVSTTGYGTWIPSAPVASSPKAEQNGFEIEWSATSNYGNSSYTVKVYDGNTLIRTISSIADTNYYYMFDRSIDGYPEKTTITGIRNLANYKIVINHSNEAYPNGTDSNDIILNTDDYGTWRIPQITADCVNITVSDRTCMMRMVYPTTSLNLYGTVQFKVSIKRVGISSTDDTLITDPSYVDNQFFKPDLYGSFLSDEDAYKDILAEENYVINSSAFSQTLPLLGQNGTTYVSGGLVNTVYCYRIIPFSEAYNDNTNYIDRNVTALCTSIRDVVKANADYKELYVEKLSAITADVGLISQGGFGDFENLLNYWALSNLSAEDTGHSAVKGGAFRVGGEDEYFKVTPPHFDDNDTDNFKLELKAGNITLTSSGDGTTFTKGTFIYDENDQNKRLALTPTGIIAQQYDSINQVWKNLATVSLDSKGNMIISNKADSIDFGLTVNGDIYHFDTDTNAENGGNPQSLTCTGNVISSENENILLDKRSSTGVFSGDITKNISSFTGNAVFFSKTNRVLVGNKYISSEAEIGTYVNPNDYNTLMTQSIDSSTVGELMGFSASQISSNIFKEYAGE